MILVGLITLAADTQDALFSRNTHIKMTILTSSKRKFNLSFLKW
jgi:hypothetical protein